MTTATAGTLIDPTPDYGPQALADHEAALPDIRQASLAWLTDNNVNDQKVLFWMGTVLLIIGLAARGWWALALAACLYLAIPMRRIAHRFFERGDVREGLLVANATTWALTIPTVLVVPDAIPIALLNVVGPLILAATYFEQQLVRRLIPVGLGLAIALGFASQLLSGPGLDEIVPAWVYAPVLVGYTAVAMSVVLQDVQESNRVRLRLLRRTVETNEELAAAGETLRESRRRLVIAADEERSRLERNLHDGAQQRLSSLALRLRLAAELSDEGRPPTSEELYRLHEESVAAIDELREFTSGVFPARLADLGLVGAVRSMSRRVPLAVTVSGDDVVGLGDDVALGLYFAISEAVQNATKHAGEDAQIEIDFSSSAAAGEVLVVKVSDDGAGFDLASLQHRRGLLNIEDRVAAVGGTVTIETAPGRGTMYTMSVPRGGTP